jgi:tRNA A-37 threonylcarbamoyl transferase component Bud32
MAAGFGTDATVLSDEAKQKSPASTEPFAVASIEELNRLLPQFEFFELLGRGGMGAVYKARQRDLDRTVAIKVLPRQLADEPGFSERFTREAKALASLNHPHIVTIHDFGQADGQFYLVMEYVDGVNLRQALQAGKLNAEQALAIVPQMCDALQFAHEAGIVHRDIKPENILLDKRGRVRIADFGLAKLVGNPDVALTGQYQVMGTLRYMAPEQMEGAHGVDHRADIYSLGVVFYEMLTGEIPMGRFAPPSKKVAIDVRLDEVVLRALEREPEQRYQQASEVKTQVEMLQGLSPLTIRRLFGREFKSKITVFGLPLVHIASGIDPATGQPRVAKGIIAIGAKAIGVFASGGIAIGGVTFGGVSLGLFSVGGLALGLLMAIGGCAAGGFAWGGVGCGLIAMGGVAFGLYSFGGAAFGLYVMSGHRQDAEALALFGPWAFNWPIWLTALVVISIVLQAVVFGTSWLVLRAQETKQGSSAH